MDFESGICRRDLLIFLSLMNKAIRHLHDKDHPYVHSIGTSAITDI